MAAWRVRLAQGGKGHRSVRWRRALALAVSSPGPLQLSEPASVTRELGWSQAPVRVGVDAGREHTGSPGPAPGSRLHSLRVRPCGPHPATRAPCAPAGLESRQTPPFWSAAAVVSPWAGAPHSHPHASCLSAGSILDSACGGGRTRGRGRRSALTFPRHLRFSAPLSRSPHSLGGSLRGR